jgi:tRNA(fMet)-specific endonuclease VapC
VTLYVLDTDSLSLFERRHLILIKKIETTPSEELAITIITIREQLNGFAYRFNRP